MRTILASLAAISLLVAACAVAPVAPPPAAAVDAKALYAAKCAGCHAPDGSKGLKGKTADQVIAALNGYKAKAYGGAKKEIMEARAAALSDAEVTALGKYVSGL